MIFDRSLSGKYFNHKNCSTVLAKDNGGAKIPRKVLVILYQALAVSVMEYGLGILTLSKSHLQRLDVIRNEGIRALLSCI